jgi:hypothetical protein
MQCDWLVPSFDKVLTQGKVVECLLDEGHKGEHLSLLPTGRYIVWAPDDPAECDCEQRGMGYCGHWEDDFEDFSWNEISSEEAASLLAK